MARPEAIVVGAGPGGLAAAIALRRAGIAPTVYERRPTLAEVGSGLTLWPNAMRALEAIGMAHAVRAVSAPAEGIAIRSARGRVLDATGPDLMRRRFDGGGVALHRADLQRVLAAAVGPGSIRLGAHVVAVEQDERGVAAVLADGSRARADLLVGADGIRSRVRGAVLGDVPLRHAGYTVWRAVAAANLPDTAGTLTMGRGAQFGLFPMTDGRVYWFASLNAPERAGDGVARDRLLRAFAGWHDPIPAVLTGTPADAIVATPIYDIAPQPRRAKGRCVLVGDAAHPATPALGQGACQAIEDVVVLARCLENGAEVEGALREYEHLRVGRTNAMTRQARRMGAMGQWENRVACWIRDRVIALTPARAQERQLEWMFSFDL
jgi:2-polyprenyl-6-methoxyphenol hydroxylase-like FAD-dependent oxidoreductase